MQNESTCILAKGGAAQSPPTYDEVGKPPKISVVITCFNYQRYIEHAIDSVLAQSHAPTEIIVIDDGSTDGTTPFLRDRFGHVDAIQVITTPNRGQLAAFCEGVRRSTGDVVSLLDADDTWDPSYLERISEELSRRESIDFVIVNIKFFGARSGIWNESTQNADCGLTSCLTSLSDPPPWIGSPTSGLSIRRSLFQRLLLPEEFYIDWKIQADNCLVLGGSILGAHKLYIADTLVNYRVHDSNNWTNGKWTSVKACTDEMKQERMLNYYRKKAYGSKKPNVHILHFEFKTTSRPSLQRLWTYLSLLPKTSGSSRARLKVGLMLTKYWWLQLFQKQSPTP
jgi:glycosyltransferase involved in cell wall biosynthesis